MFSTKEKAPAGRPTLNPDDSLGEPLPFVFEPSNDDRNTVNLSTTDEEDEDETLYRAVELPYGKLHEAPTTAGTFTGLTHELLDQMAEAGVLHLAGLWTVLERALRTNRYTGNLVASPLKHEEIAQLLKPNKPPANATIKEQLRKLEEAGFITVYATRQTVSQGNSKRAGNCYVPHGLRLSDAEARTARQTIEVSHLAGVSVDNAIEAGVTSGTSPAPSTSPASISPQKTSESTKKTIGWLTTTRETDILKPARSRKSQLASEEQIKVVREHLWEPAVLRLYGISRLDQLTNAQAHDLIRASKGQNPETEQRLASVTRTIEAERDERARQERQRLYEQQERYRSERAPETPDWLKEFARLASSQPQR